ncbi:MAG: hypothetical protein U9Q06_00005 [Nanoarchaeota archaeon]|nr:hypothetical protein [Nanoarchaeota archaeon]
MEIKFGRNFGKRGVANVVAVILILILTVGAVSLIGSYALVLVKGVIGEIELSESCTSVLLDINTQGGYSCYDAINGEVRMAVGRGAGVSSHQGHQFVGMNVKTSGETEDGLKSKNYDILEGSNAYTRGAEKFYGEYVDLLGEHEDRVYVVNVDYPVDRVSVTPIIGVGSENNLCPSRNDVILEVCSSTFDPITFLVYDEQEMGLLNGKRGWPVTGFVGSRTDAESLRGNYSISVSGGSAAFDANIGIEKADYLEFSYKKENADSYLSVFYHVSCDDDNEWIEITDALNRGYVGLDIPHEEDTEWHTITIDLEDLEDVGTCNGYVGCGVVDDFQFTVWDSTTVCFDNVKFY